MDTSGINKAIFKNYDIRGIYPDDLNGEAAYWTGRALGKMIGKGPVILGRDMRLGGNELFANVLKGLNDSGVDVCDIGIVPVEAVYFAVAFLDYSGGVMITASHNPKEYNGFKMVVKKTPIPETQKASLKENPSFSTGSTMEWIRGLEILDFLSKNEFPDLETKGVSTKRDIWKEYIEHVLKFADVSKIKRLKVVVDAGNGMAGKVIPMLAPHLPIDVTPLSFELDGNFPNHPSNPLIPESQEEITQKVLAIGADLGVIFDGDADRLFFVDDKGEFIRADMTLLLLAKKLLEENPGAGVAYNVICSRMVPEKIKEWGGVPLRAAVGFVIVANAMRENNGVMGGELSGHYSFRDNGFADSGFIALLIILQMISESGQKLSEIMESFQKYAKGDEVNFSLEGLSAPGVIEEVSKRYADAKQDRLDGLTFEYPDWWANVRASNTEPLLRVTIEANTPELFVLKKDELLGFIKSLKK